MKPKSQLIRVKDSFAEEIEEIRNSRKEKDITKLSYTKITSLIMRHKNWPKIKLDIVNYQGNEDE